MSAETTRDESCTRRPGRLRRDRLRPAFLRTVLAVALTAVAGAGGESAVSTFDPDDQTYLRRQFTYFRNLSAERQSQIRKLHQEFSKLDSEEQARLARVMQAYNAWLAKLPEGERKRVVSAATAEDRLANIQRLRERDWIDSLPKTTREELAKLDDRARRIRIDELKVEELDRRDDWNVVKQQWPAILEGKLPQQLTAELRQTIETYSTNLRNQLTDAERNTLDELQKLSDEPGGLFLYIREVVKLADNRTLLPGKPGAKDYNSLPEVVKEYLLKSDPHFRKKKGILLDEPKELRRSVGRWPDYSIELTQYCRKNNLKLPIPLGECRKEQMPPEVQKFIEQALEPTLRKTEPGRQDLDALNRSAGSWPEYPRMLIDLAKKYKLTVPGYMLPASATVLDKFRPKGKVK